MSGSAQATFFQKVARWSTSKRCPAWALRWHRAFPLTAHLPAGDDARPSMTRTTTSLLHRARYVVIALLLAGTAGCTRGEPVSPPSPANTHSAQPLFSNGSFDGGLATGGR